MNKIADALEGSIKMSAHHGDRFERDVVGQQAWRAVQEIRRLVTERNALEAERDRYMAALEYIESTPTTWTLGVDENMERLRTIATQALGGGDE